MKNLTLLKNKVKLGYVKTLNVIDTINKRPKHNNC